MSKQVVKQIEGFDQAIEDFLKMNADDLKKLNPHFKEKTKKKSLEAAGTGVASTHKS